MYECLKIWNKWNLLNYNCLFVPHSKRSFHRERGTDVRAESPHLPGKPHKYRQLAGSLYCRRCASLWNCLFPLFTCNIINTFIEIIFFDPVKVFFFYWNCWMCLICRPNAGDHRVLLLRRPPELSAQKTRILHLLQAGGGLSLSQRHAATRDGGVSLILVFSSLLCVEEKKSAIVFTIQPVRRMRVFGQKRDYVWLYSSETRLLLSSPQWRLERLHDHEAVCCWHPAVQLFLWKEAIATQRQACQPLSKSPSTKTRQIKHFSFLYKIKNYSVSYFCSQVASMLRQIQKARCLTRTVCPWTLKTFSASHTKLPKAWSF